MPDIKGKTQIFLTDKWFQILSSKPIINRLNLLTSISFSSQNMTIIYSLSDIHCYGVLWQSIVLHLYSIIWDRNCVELNTNMTISDGIFYTRLWCTVFKRRKLLMVYQIPPSSLRLRVRSFYGISNFCFIYSS